MRVSTRARYGLRFMFELALWYGKGFVLLKDVASREELSEKYLSQIAIPLRARGLIKSGRGARGGYVLARAPAKITAREVVEALEGDIVLTECVQTPRACKRSEICPTRAVWDLVGRRIRETLEATTLEDLVEMHQSGAERPANFSI